jgi:hypothetical protein
MFKSASLIAITVLCAACAVSTPEMQDYEPSSPIPRLSVIDVHGVRKSGGSDLLVVIASPLKNDDHSVKRLSQKLNNYIEAIASKGYAEKYGEPTPSNTSIVVDIHPDSDPEIFRLLEQYRPKVEAVHASLRVELLDVAK